MKNLENIKITLKSTDKKDNPLKGARVQVSSIGIYPESGDLLTDESGCLQVKLSLESNKKLPIPLLLTLSLRGYRIRTHEILVADGIDSYECHVVMEPVTIEGFPYEDFRFETVCLSSVGSPQTCDDELIAHPKICYFREKYIMLYTARGGGVWVTAAAISSDGIHWDRVGPLLTPQIIDPDGSRNIECLYTAQPIVFKDTLYVIAGSKGKNGTKGISAHNLWLFKNDQDLLDAKSWKVVNNKPFMGKEDLWGYDPQDARIYILNNPPFIEGCSPNKFWMFVTANPKNHNNIEAQHTMVLSASSIEGPYAYVKTALSTPSWFCAEWPGSIIQMGSRYYWLSTHAEAGALYGESSKGILYWSDDFLTWNKLSGEPLIFPQPYPAFDDLYTGEFEFQLSPDNERVFVYYAARSLDKGKKTIACYSFKATELNIDLLK